MNIEQATIIWKHLTAPSIIELYSGLIINDGTKPLWNFHQWADGKKTVGAIRLTNPDTKNTLHFLVIDWPDDDLYYLVIFPENKNGPIVEIKDWHIGKDRIASLSWRYKPMKHDRKNEARKKYFTENFGDTLVYINIPSEPIYASAFVNELFIMVDNRLKADVLSSNGPIQRDGFPEGKEREVRHIQRERNPYVVKRAKEEFLRKHKKLFCQACQQDHIDQYGQIASNCFEAHHTVPVSELPSNAITQIRDIAIVCANCHRLLHRKRPWLTMSRLSEIMKEHYK